jgi:hypothetical protein
MAVSSQLLDLVRFQVSGFRCQQTDAGPMVGVAHEMNSIKN